MHQGGSQKTKKKVSVKGDCGLRTADCGLQTADCRLQTRAKMQTKCKMQAGCKMQNKRLAFFKHLIVLLLLQIGEIASRYQLHTLLPS